MIMPFSRRLIIFEGPDCAGKSTLAKAWAGQRSAYYVHSGPFTGVRSIARLYREAMMPAVLGMSDVVMDRCWLSEKPYGDALRGGYDRLVGHRRGLERIAMRCETTVVLCLPPYEAVLKGYLARRSEELLDGPTHLKAVYEHYAGYGFETFLPVVCIDPLSDPVDDMVKRLDVALSYNHTISHFTNTATSGNLKAKTIIVGRSSDPQDTIHRLPFGGVTYSGCDRMLSLAFDHHGIDERSLMWVDPSCVTGDSVRAGLWGDVKLLAIGGETASHLTNVGVPFERVFSHPSEMRSTEEYDLAAYLKENA